MKSYLLIGASPLDAIQSALDEMLPGQRDPWLILSSPEDPIAYLHIGSDGEVIADISGRHYNEDARVLAIINALKLRFGGEIEYAP